MIEVENLVKNFAGVKAVKNMNFSVKPGEVVGFLGPNGAGKTTMMRILSGYMPATSGSVRVGGLDVMDHSKEVRGMIGYLPESCPLYLDMRVNEYLNYRARLKGLNRRVRKRRVREVKEQFGLSDVGRRVIGQLSKGFRQRVGFADTLVHEPPLLILDEPTVGLDPNQIREVRRLIKDLGKKHTVLLSTHILSEVDVTCERVLIMNEGEIIASDAPWNLRNLLSQGARITIELCGDVTAITGTLSTLTGVTEVEVEPIGDWLRVVVQCATDVDLRTKIYQTCHENNWVLRELREEPQTLEDVFVKLTNAKEGRF